MPDPAAASGGDARYLTFRVAEQLYALPAEEVAEVIRTPHVARVPQAPESLLGLANLRGTVLPVASARSLLSYAPADASRSIVLSGGAPVALAIDEIEGLVAIAAGQVETRQAELAAREGERITGAFAVGGGEFAKVLDIRSLLATAFTARPRPVRQAGVGSSAPLAERVADEAAVERLVTFEAAGQEFGLPLASVREIVPPPANLTAIPRGEALVLGVTAYRDSLLPLLSLRGLLGFAPATTPSGREKVVVVSVGGVLVGLVADRTRAIVAADPALVEPIPPVLAARTGGESRVKAIYRGEGGRRLISILAADQLFREDVMQRLAGAAPAPDGGEGRAEGASDELRLLVFRLGDDDFALPIEVVDEVARVPEQITRVPKTPRFLEGVVNLRGEVLPIIDQRRRFDMPASDRPEGRRLIVVRTERHRAGVIVDSVSEVLRSTPSAVEPAPDLAGETTRLVHGVVNLDGGGRIVLLLDPAELLTRAERGLLDAFTGDEQAAT